MIYLHTQRQNLFYIGLDKNYYFESERPSHLLALRLKECESKAYISAIKSSDDQVTMYPVSINDIFKGFYTICIKPKQILMNQFVSSI